MTQTPGSNAHSGGCHCGAVRYRVELDLSKPAFQCNCSMCARAGTLLSFVPASAFTLETGEASLTGYQFNKNVINHMFCRVCGIKPFARGKNPDGSPKVAVNVRCLDDFELANVTIQSVDGKSW